VLVRLEQSDEKGPVYVNPRCVASVQHRTTSQAKGATDYTTITMDVRWADEDGCDHDYYAVEGIVDEVAAKLNAAEAVAGAETEAEKSANEGA